MIGREEQEKREYEILTKYACRSGDSRGRDFPEDKCTVRTEFQRDRDRIIHSKAFRRLMHKTQVFLSPEGDHYRTRLTHTIEVSQIARTISRALGLNEDLAEAIAMGHDLGHTPFGHGGEKVLDKVYPEGFKHNIQSIRVVEVLEGNPRKGGMNLTVEVKDGIRNHTGEGVPLTLEGKVVKISDRIAYINHDIDDALRSGVIAEGDLPRECIEYLGAGHRERIDTLVKDMIANSYDAGEILMSDVCSEYMDRLRSFMFRNVYLNPDVKKNEESEKIQEVVTGLYHYYSARSEELPQEMQWMLSEYGVEETVKDYIAGMTDRYAMNSFEEIKK